MFSLYASNIQVVKETKKKYNKHNLQTPKDKFKKENNKIYMKTAKIFFVAHKVRPEIMERNYVFLDKDT